MASDPDGTHGSRTVGGVVSKREGSTTIVIGGPFASAAIVVPDEPAPRAGPVYADRTSDADLPARDLPAVFGSVALPDASALLDAAALLDASALPGEADLVGDAASFDGSVVMEADRILADSAALEDLWRLPAVTEEQRQTVGKQA
jgi:hypothetical protein